MYPNCSGGLLFLSQCMSSLHLLCIHSVHPTLPMQMVWEREISVIVMLSTPEDVDMVSLSLSLFTLS